MTVFIIDTETNGAEKPEVIELAYAEPGKAAAVARFRPQVPSTWGALAVHHILPEDLEFCIPSTEAKLPPCQYIIGHNVDYDWDALGRPPVKRICTLAIARFLYPTLESHKLGALYYMLRGATEQTRSALRDAHSAAADVYFCEFILQRMLNAHRPELTVAPTEELWAFSEDCRLPRIISFGKYKGTPINKLPSDYVAWMHRQPDMDPYVIAALKKFRGGR